MATNNNLQDLRLGAPPSISISANQYPNADVSVQLMSRCSALTLHDAADGTRCTREGALMTAIRLIRQRVAERAVGGTTWEGHSLAFGVGADALLQFLCHGGSVPLALSADGAAVDARSVWWEVADVRAEEGAVVTVSPDGVLSVSADCDARGTVKAISKADSTMQVWMSFGVYPALAAIVAQYPALAAIVAQYPALAPVLVERPELAAIVNEWPEVVNSLVETGKRNYLTFNGSAWFNTGQVTKQGYDYHCYSRLGQNATRFWQGIFGDSWANGIGCLANNATDFWTRIAGSEKHVTGVDLKQWHWLKASSVRSAVDDKETAYGVTISTTQNMCIGAVPPLSQTQGHVGDISEFIVYDTEGKEYQHFVPFVRNGESGMLDIVNFDFITKMGNGTAILTENEAIG